MKLGVILESMHIEKRDNALRIVHHALNTGDSVKFFLIGFGRNIIESLVVEIIETQLNTPLELRFGEDYDAVYSWKSDKPSSLKSFFDNGGELYIDEEDFWSRESGDTKKKLVSIGEIKIIAIEEMYDRMKECDKILTF